MTTVPLAVARARLSRLVNDAVRTHERIEVTKNGRRTAVIFSAADDDSLIETLDILGDTEAMAEIRQADAGRVTTLEDVDAEMRSLGRLTG